MENVFAQQVNPLSRRPGEIRLVLGLRGKAGAGKSHFVASMAEAGLGRLCVLDVERKMRLVPRVNERFDALEIERASEVSAFIDWAVAGEGASRNYGCLALDSYGAYFGTLHAAAVERIRSGGGDPSTEEGARTLRAELPVFQDVLRKLANSKRHVVITDTLSTSYDAWSDAGDGLVLPQSYNGLEYAVDVLVDVSIEMRDGEITRVFQVQKSNSPRFEIGEEFTGDAVCFRTFLDRLSADRGAEATSGTRPSSSDVSDDTVRGAVAPFLAPRAAPRRLAITDILADAAGRGVTRAAVATWCRAAFPRVALDRLSHDQLVRVETWLHSRPSKPEAGSTPSDPVVVIAPGTGGGGGGTAPAAGAAGGGTDDGSPPAPIAAAPVAAAPGIVLPRRQPLQQQQQP